MKIGIISIGDYRHITLISKYTSYFEENRIPYDVICTDRYTDPIEKDNVFQYAMPSTKSKLDKVKSFIAFKRWAQRLIVQNHYDFLVIWNENTALLFSDFLLRKFKGRYCVNIRDVDFLNQTILNVIRGKVITNSSFSTYCSKARLEFPKGYNYVLMRSMNLDVLKHVKKRETIRSESEPIRIVFVGKVRFFDADKELIQAFGNDRRYEVWYIGAGSENLEYLKEQYNNLFLVGKYTPDETAKYLEMADVINSYFGTKVLGYERMSSIRFSYAPYIHVPVIVGTNTNMEEEGKTYGFAYGFGAVECGNEADAFYKWYRNIDSPKFIEGCEKYCSDIYETDLIFYETLAKKLEDFR